MYAINIIDTPGVCRHFSSASVFGAHLSLTLSRPRRFRIEVECAFRVLDGAVLQFLASRVKRSHMQRYNVSPLSFISFINKVDTRPRANCRRGINQIWIKLRIPAVAVKVPIGVEDQFGGVVDQ
ncbi:hypothetical protein BJV78DRAFT_942515 [Lactifluus subvellereus]|nr:hypothetical protein BJV78DRAFT_942515 [Lactifluus subvellereus]